MKLLIILIVLLGTVYCGKVPGRRPGKAPGKAPGKGLKSRVDCPPCDTGSDSDTDWNIDSGNVPENLDGGSNDGLDGLDSDNNDDWTTDSTNWDDSWTATWDDATETEAPTEDLWGTESSKNEPAEVTPRPNCVCMTLIECGATWRSGNLEEESEESLCAREGEICCEIPADAGTPPGNLPEEPVGTSGLQCGESKPQPNVAPSQALTDENADYAEFPWTVTLVYKDNDISSNGVGDYRCAGTLIYNKIVVTAAHCFTGQNKERIIVRAGDWDLQESNVLEPLPIQERHISELIKHPKFNAGNPPYDIAIIVVDEPFTLTDNVNTLCLPPSAHSDFDHENCWATGWGKTPTGKTHNIMKKISLPIMPRKECQSALRTTRLGKYFKLDKSFLCAGGQAGKDVCAGDGGGPLACRQKDSTAMVLVGITSWGIGCGKVGIPGVFTNVPFVSTWLFDTVSTILA